MYTSELGEGLELKKLAEVRERIDHAIRVLKDPETVGCRPEQVLESIRKEIVQVKCNHIIIRFGVRLATCTKCNMVLHSRLIREDVVIPDPSKPRGVFRGYPTRGELYYEERRGGSYV